MTDLAHLALVAAMLAITTTAAGAASPIVIAHRGASGYLPEHTLPAKAMAHAQAAGFIEQDIVLTRDDVPVVLHDVYLDAVSDVAERYPGRARADGRHYAIDFTLEELRGLRLWERCDPETGRPTYPGRFPPRTGVFRIATLEEELDLLDGLARSTGRRAGVYPEIKQPAWHRREGHDPTPIIAEVLRRRGLDGKDAACFVQCFEADELERLRTSLGWQGRLILLVGEAPADGPDPLLTPGALAKQRSWTGSGRHSCVWSEPIAGRRAWWRRPTPPGSPSTPTRFGSIGCRLSRRRRRRRWRCCSTTRESTACSATSRTSASRGSSDAGPGAAPQTDSAAARPPGPISNLKKRSAERAGFIRARFPLSRIFCDS